MKDTLANNEARASQAEAANDSPEVSDNRLYSVTALGRELGISARTLRFYEDSGLIAPGRAGNKRIYSHRDRARKIIILRGKRLGFSLREIKEYLDLYSTDRTQQGQLHMLLLRHTKKWTPLFG